MRFIVYNQSGKILRTGNCAGHDLHLQARQNEFAIKGTANDVTQKIVDGKVVNKTPEEIERDKPPEPKLMPHGKQFANITNEQLQVVLNRLEKLETEA